MHALVVIAGFMPTLELRVEKIDAITPRIRRLVLATVDGSAVPSYEPGAHLELHVPDEDGAVRLHRAYSLVTPADGGSRCEIAVQREDGGDGGSRWVHGLLEGARVKASTPRNLFPLVPSAQDHLLLAAGIGITPILCMARALRNAQARFTLHYAARSPQEAAYCEEVASMPGARCWFDGGDPQQGLPLGEAIGAADAHRHLYVCGPKGFIAAALAAALALGWDESTLHCELFAGSLEAAGDRAFSVDLAVSGRTLDVPAGTTVLEAMEAAGLDSMFDCRRGDCGVCVVKVLGGEPDHRDMCLSPRDRQSGSFCACVSRARSDRLVLEI